MRIPLDIVVTATGAKTGGVVVAVMASDLDALEAENERLRNIIEQARSWVGSTIGMVNDFSGLIKILDGGET